MHRTTTTAALLVTVAVAALTGCVTVQRPPVPGPPPTAPSQPSAPRPDGEREQQTVQAPAKEALEMIGPSRRPEPRTPRHHGPVAKAPAPAERPPAPRSRPRPHPRAPQPHHRHQPQPPRVKVPDVGGSVPKNTKDLCALGRRYGGWRADSPESVICKQAYGR
ncbi:hypothetical protein [Streptomyces panaciradicis]|uniref:hypothetical protein n=1 Tax=Streptomyces panaciradicis TaxID=1470261 RepID=UPI00201D1DE8|nr:hypothetical protein [Streptomyces panaciradicis]MCL6672370.1 hypothetical protein [Streptomyces panaciradicis]